MAHRCVFFFPSEFHANGSSLQYHQGLAHRRDKTGSAHNANLEEELSVFHFLSLRDIR